MQLISTINTNKFIDIIINANINKNISIMMPISGIKLEVNSLSDSKYEEKYHGMYQRFFTKNEKYSPLIIGDFPYMLYYNVGKWGYDTDIDDAHISLGCSAFGSYFAQIEVSYCLEDKDKIYIVKNISNLAGRGAISRLNPNKPSNQQEARYRRILLNKKTKLPTFSFNKREWLVIYSVNISDLHDEKQENTIITDFMKNFLLYSFTIEEILEERKNYLSTNDLIIR